MIYAALVVLCLLCGWRTDGLRVLSFGFAAGWLLFVTSWGPWSAAMALSDAGIYTTSPEVWAIADATNGMLALRYGHKHWWGFALWFLYVAQCVMHVSFLGGWSWGQYKSGLDATFLMQVAVFLMAGGKGVYDAGMRFCAGDGDLLRRGFLRARNRGSLEAGPVDGH